MSTATPDDEFEPLSDKWVNSLDANTESNRKFLNGLWSRHHDEPITFCGVPVPADEDLMVIDDPEHIRILNERIERVLALLNPKPWWHFITSFFTWLKK